VLKCFLKKNSKITYSVKITREDNEEKKIAQRNEFKLMKEIKHPNIISSIDIFENEFKGEIYMVMDYVEGRELSEIIAERGKLQEQDSLLILKQLL